MGGRADGRKAPHVVAALLVAVLSSPATAQSLRGSPGTVDRQNQAALAHDFTFLNDAQHVQRFVEAGYLVPVRSNDAFRVKRIGFPYARPEVELFLSRLGRQYREACGEELVVTSLTRPWSRQPRNASSRSVHPTGMAVDLRRSTRRACRQWLESVLLSLEGKGVLEAVRETRPPHYHVAVFPKQYAAYVRSIEASTPADKLAEATPAPTHEAAGRPPQYRVRNGDTLWTIARRNGTTVQMLRVANDLRGNRIYPGQVLELR